MKGLKKFLTGILAGAMALSMTLTAGSAMTAKAANDGTITVSNTTKDETYTLYKVFDATFSGDNVAYTYTGKNEAFKTALKDSGLFDYDGVNVVKKEGASDTAVLEFIKNNAAAYEKVKEMKGNGSSITFSGLAYGYYYIKSSLDSVVTIDSAVPAATVIDKNQGSTVDKQESIDGETWLYQEMGKEEATVPTAKIGDTVNYKVVGTLTQYIGEEEVTNFTFTDTMSAGLTPTNVDGIVLKLNGTKVEGYTKSVDGQTITIDVPKALLTESNMEYEITYSAVINEKSVVATPEKNTVVLTYNNTYKVGEDSTKVVNYKLSLKKTAKSVTGTVLAGAKFKLYTVAEGGEALKLVLVSGTGDVNSEVNNVYRFAKSDDKNVVEEMVTGATGIIEVLGLNNGDYYFEETAAPEGYNILTDRKVAKINNENAAQLPVVNNTGSILPSTGGIGTTIFYIIGGLLIVAAVVFFVVRRKADAE